MNVVIRGFKRARLVFEQRVDVSDDAFAVIAESMAKQHVQAMHEGRIGMIEIEFCDAPELERFVRFGVEPHGMVMPIAINHTPERN